MSNRHAPKLIDRARDELFSHVIRCDVLESAMNDRVEWLEDTMDYMAHRYPQLTDLQIAHLEAMGRRFIKPAIPHGARTTAMNRSRWQSLPAPDKASLSMS